MPGLTREEIEARVAERAKEVTEVPVPEWGGSVYVRRLNAGDVEDTGLMSEGADSGVHLKVLLAALCDEDGKSLFDDGDEDVLRQFDAGVTIRLFTEAARINGLLSEDLEEAVASFAQAQPDARSTS